jgi:hypothetical protein
MGRVLFIAFKALSYVCFVLVLAAFVSLFHRPATP